MIRELLTSPNVMAGPRSALHAALAQVLDARGDFEQAADHARQGNALCLANSRKRGQGYDPADHARFVDGLLAAFTPAYFERVRGFGLDSERPVFIVGLPRSGTTLVEQILASHSQVFGAGELRLGREAFDSLPGVLNFDETASACVSRLDRAAVRRVAQRHLEQLGQLNTERPSRRRQDARQLPVPGAPGYACFPGPG